MCGHDKLMQRDRPTDLAPFASYHTRKRMVLALISLVRMITVIIIIGVATDALLLSLLLLLLLLRCNLFNEKFRTHSPTHAEG